MQRLALCPFQKPAPTCPLLHGSKSQSRGCWFSAVLRAKTVNSEHKRVGLLVQLRFLAQLVQEGKLEFDGSSFEVDMGASPNDLYVITWEFF